MPDTPTDHGLTGFRGLIADSISNPDNLVGYGGNKAVFRINGEDDLLLGVSYYGTAEQRRARFEHLPAKESDHLLDNYDLRELAPPQDVKPTQAFFDALKRSTHLTPPQHLYTAHGVGQEIAYFTREGFQKNGLMLIRRELGRTLLDIENEMVAETLGTTPEEALKQYRERKAQEYTIDRQVPTAHGREEALKRRTEVKKALIEHYSAQPHSQELAARQAAHTHIIEHMFLPNLERIYDELSTYNWTATPDASDLKPDNILWDETAGKLTFIDQGTPNWQREKRARESSVTNCLDKLEEMFDEYSYDVAPELRERFETQRNNLRSTFLEKLNEPFASVNMRGNAITHSSHIDVRAVELDTPETTVLASARKWLRAISQGIEEHSLKGRA